MDVTKLAYEPINEKYSKAKYLGIECIMNMTNGYINATKFCASSGDGKTFDKYLRLDRCKELIKYFEERFLEGNKAVIKDNSYGYLRGTYIHPDLIIDVALWLSPSVYFVINKIVKEWRQMSFQNENRFWNDMSKAFEETKDMCKKNNKESIVRDKIAKDENGLIEIETPVGFIDVLTDTKVIEVKTKELWKHALGQVQSYGFYYPNKEQWLYLFDSKEKENQKENETIIEICKSKSVNIKYI